MDDGGAADNIRVYCRVRPLQKGARRGIAAVEDASRVVINNKQSFNFGWVAGPDSTQEAIFENVGKPLAQSFLDGFNGCIFAYGQTGSGKTFTIHGPGEGSGSGDDEGEHRGLLPRVLEFIFDALDSRVAASKPAGAVVTHSCKASFLEIYNERIYDLQWDPATAAAAAATGSAADGASGGAGAASSFMLREPPSLSIREKGGKGAGGVFVEGLTETPVVSVAQAQALLAAGVRNRRVAATAMNHESSRSHSVFTLTLETQERQGNGAVKTRTAAFHLIDLAGSERQKSTGATGQLLKEASQINKSLSALAGVIGSLVDISQGKQRHVHYRDSKLTHLLKDSLGGNSKTSIIATVSPAETCLSETVATLNFAQSAKLVKNKAVVNESSSRSAAEYMAEIAELRRLIAQMQALKMVAAGSPAGAAGAAAAAAAAGGGRPMLSLGLRLAQPAAPTAAAAAGTPAAAASAAGGAAAPGSMGPLIGRRLDLAMADAAGDEDGGDARMAAAAGGTAGSPDGGASCFGGASTVESAATARAAIAASLLQKWDSLLSEMLVIGAEAAMAGKPPAASGTGAGAATSSGSASAAATAATSAIGDIDTSRIPPALLEAFGGDVQQAVSLLQSTRQAAATGDGLTRDIAPATAAFLLQHISGKLSELDGGDDAAAGSGGCLTLSLAALASGRVQELEEANADLLLRSERAHTEVREVSERLAETELQVAALQTHLQEERAMRKATVATSVAPEAGAASSAASAIVAPSSASISATGAAVGHMEVIPGSPADSVCSGASLSPRSTSASRMSTASAAGLPALPSSRLPPPSRLMAPKASGLPVARRQSTAAPTPAATAPVAPPAPPATAQRSHSTSATGARAKVGGVAAATPAGGATSHSRTAAVVRPTPGVAARGTSASAAVRTPGLATSAPIPRVPVAATAAEPAATTAAVAAPLPVAPSPAVDALEAELAALRADRDRLRAMVEDHPDTHLARKLESRVRSLEAAAATGAPAALVPETTVLLPRKLWNTVIEEFARITKEVSDLRDAHELLDPTRFDDLVAHRSRQVEGLKAAAAEAEAAAAIKLAEAEATIATLRADVEFASTEITQYGEQASAYEEKLAELRDANEEICRTAAHHELQAAEAASKIARLSEELHALKSADAGIKEATAVSDRIRAELEATLSRTHEELASARASADLSKQALVAAEGRLRDVDAQRATAVATMEKHRSEAAELRKEVTDCRKELEALRVERDAASASAAASTAEHATLSKALAEAQAALAEKTKKAASLESELRSLEFEFSVNEKNATDLEECLTTYQDDLHKAEDRVAELEAEVDRLKAGAGAAAAKTAPDAATVTAAEAAAAEASRLRTRVEELEADMQVTMESLRESQEEIAQAQAATEKVRQERAAAVEAAEALRLQLAEADVAKEAAVAERTTMLEADLNELESEIKKLDAEKLVLTAKIDELQEAVRTARRDEQEAIEVLDTEVAKHAEYKAKAAGLAAEVEALKASLTEAQAAGAGGKPSADEVAAMQAEVQALRASMEKAHAEAEDLQDMLNESEADLEAAKAAVAAASTRAEETAAELAAVKAELEEAAAARDSARQLADAAERRATAAAEAVGALQDQLAATQRAASAAGAVQAASAAAAAEEVRVVAAGANTLRDQVAQLLTKLAAAEATVATMTAAADETASALAAAVAERDAAADQLVHAQQAVRETDATAAAAINARDVAQAQLDMLEAAATNAASSAQAELERMQSATEAACARVASLEADVSSWMARYHVALDEKVQLEEQLERAHEQLAAAAAGAPSTIAAPAASTVLPPSALAHPVAPVLLAAARSPLPDLDVSMGGSSKAPAGKRASGAVLRDITAANIASPVVRAGKATASGGGVGWAAAARRQAESQGAMRGFFC